MRRWTDLSRPEDKFIQCPFTILNLDIKPITLKLYLILWQEAFVFKKRRKGVQYAQMTYNDMLAELHCSRTTLCRAIQELVEHKLVVAKKNSRQNIYFFTTKDNWI